MELDEREKNTGSRERKKTYRILRDCKLYLSTLDLLRDKMYAVTYSRTFFNIYRRFLLCSATICNADMNSNKSPPPLLSNTINVSPLPSSSWPASYLSFSLSLPLSFYLFLFPSLFLFLSFLSFPISICAGFRWISGILGRHGHESRRPLRQATQVRVDHETSTFQKEK